MYGRILLFIFCLIPAVLSASEWYEDYDKAKGKVKKGNCVEAEKLLLEALKKNPTPDNKVRPYGTITIEYIPYFYLAKCAHERGDAKTAEEYIKEAAKYRIAESSEGKAFAELRSQIEAAVRAQSEGLAIVVSRQNQTSALSMKELSDIYLGNTRHWQNGTPITPVLLNQGSKVNELFLQKVCSMDEATFADHWEKLIGGDNTRTMPIWIEQDEWVAKYIDLNPGAIGFMDPEKTLNLRVVSIDGKAHLQ